MFPSREVVMKAREEYIEGDRVRLIFTDDEYTELKSGDEGTVKYIDDVANIHIRWDNGSGLAMIYEKDIIQKI